MRAWTAALIALVLGLAVVAPVTGCSKRAADKGVDVSSTDKDAPEGTKL